MPFGKIEMSADITPFVAIMESVIEWIVNQAIAAIVGAIISAGVVAIWSCIQRKRLAAEQRLLAAEIEKAFQLVRRVCEPEIMDPAYPGNQAYMKSEARDFVNPLTRRLEKAGFYPPTQCTTEDQSLQEWFRFLENARMKIG